MEAKVRTVVICTEGQYGVVQKEDYERLANSFKGILEIETGEPEGHRARGEVTICDTLDESIKVATKYVDSFATILFLSRGILEKARLVAREYRRLRVVLLTGDTEGEVILLPKMGISPDSLRKIILR